MENEIPKGTTNQPLIQFIPDAAVFTNTSFIITACNKMAATLFNYRPHDVSGFHISFLTPASSAINSQQVSLTNKAFKQGIITYVNKADKITLVHITSHAIDAESINGGFLFIYKPLDQDKLFEASSPISNGQLCDDKIILQIKDDEIGFEMQTPGVKKTLGLLGMQERTFMMGGHFEINSNAGEGTTIVITIPQSDDTAKSQADQ